MRRPLPMTRPLASPAVVLLPLLLLCAACRGYGPFGWPEPALPEPPRTEFETLAAAALRHAVLDARDLPDFALVEDPRRLVLHERILTGDTLTPGALPPSGAVTFFLLSADEIQRLADDRGDFVYLEVGDVHLGPLTATVELSTRWAVGRGSGTVHLSGGGYRLRFRRAGDGWSFERVVALWIS